MPVRNEDWILGMSARAVLMWADELVILNHASTDDTYNICIQLATEFPGRVQVGAECNPVWSEMAHRQSLLEAARHSGATHIALVDADEVLSGNLLPDIRMLFASTKPGTILQIPWLCLRGSIDRVHTSGPWADYQNVSTGFQDSAGLHWSNGSRGGYDFHHRHPMGGTLIPYTPIYDRKSGLMHLQFVSDRRLRAKQALYKVTEVLRWPGRERDQIQAVNQRYNLAVYGNHIGISGSILGMTVGDAPACWWEPYAHLMQHFHPDAEPWQEFELQKIIAEHGTAKFTGLDLFGVV